MNKEVYDKYILSKNDLESFLTERIKNFKEGEDPLFSMFIDNLKELQNQALKMGEIPESHPLYFLYEKDIIKKSNKSVCNDMGHGSKNLDIGAHMFELEVNYFLKIIDKKISPTTYEYIIHHMKKIAKMGRRVHLLEQSPVDNYSEDVLEKMMEYGHDTSIEEKIEEKFPSRIKTDSLFKQIWRNNQPENLWGIEADEYYQNFKESQKELNLELEKLKIKLSGIMNKINKLNILYNRIQQERTAVDVDGEISEAKDEFIAQSVSLGKNLLSIGQNYLVEKLGPELNATVSILKVSIDTVQLIKKGKKRVKQESEKDKKIRELEEQDSLLSNIDLLINATEDIHLKIVEISSSI